MESLGNKEDNIHISSEAKKSCNDKVSSIPDFQLPKKIRTNLGNNENFIPKKRLILSHKAIKTGSCSRESSPTISKLYLI